MEKINNIKILRKKRKIFVIKGKNTVIISQTHKAYLDDIQNYFNYYFSAVEGNNRVADFSKTKRHKVKGFSLFKIWFPSIPEPINTTNQILKFAKIKNDDVVLDLGAYSALSSIVFKLKTGKNGTCVAVEADPKNAAACKKNLKEYMGKTGENIFFENAAVWARSGTIGFSSDGAMGSTVSEKPARDEAIFFKIRAISLEDLAKKYSLKKIDFIKCDIEGSEDFIFKSRRFFLKFRPRIAVEYHNQHLNKNGLSLCEIYLQSEGYITERTFDKGSAFPLILASPKTKRKSFLWRFLKLREYYKSNGKLKEFYKFLLFIN